MNSGDIITFDGFITALSEKIADACINMNQKILPDTFKNGYVKSWTNTLTATVYPKDNGAPYIEYTGADFYIVQSPNNPNGTEMTYNMFTTAKVKNIIYQVLSENGIKQIQSKDLDVSNGMWYFQKMSDLSATSYGLEYVESSDAWLYNMTQPTLSVYKDFDNDQYVFSGNSTTQSWYANDTFPFGILTKVITDNNNESWNLSYKPSETESTSSSVSNVIEIVNNIMYVCNFSYVLKVLEKFISENFIIYVSPFYNSKLIVFEPTGSYKYNLPIDMTIDYTQSQIETYLQNFAKTVIYCIPSDNIKVLSYGTKIIKGVPVAQPKKSFSIEYEYTTGEQKFKATVKLPEQDPSVKYKMYYKNSPNKCWIETASGTEFSTTVDKTFYFYVAPADDYTILRYNELGKNNKEGFKISHTLKYVNPHSTLRTYTYGPHNHWVWYWSDKDRAAREHPGGWESRFYAVWWGWTKFDWSVYETTYDTIYVWSGKEI